jgi:hypothetical protein
MLIDLVQYAKPHNTDTCVAICFFRPVEYIKPVENLSLFLKNIQESHIPIYSIELLYPNQTPILSNATKIVRTNSVLFSKENLWNILEKNIPDNYSKIIFLDTDIRFTNPNWFNISADLLNQHMVIQPMEHCYRDIPNTSLNTYDIDHQLLRPAIAKGIQNRERINISLHYPGFGIGIDRNFFHKINGIFEYGLNGYGDSLFWAAFDRFDSQYVDFAKTKFSQYNSYLQNIQQAIDLMVEPVGYVKDNICLHLYHGTTKNRKYNTRNSYLPESYKLFFNADGVLEMSASTDLIQYWIDRKEDE